MLSIIVRLRIDAFCRVHSASPTADSWAAANGIDKNKNRSIILYYLVVCFIIKPPSFTFLVSSFLV